MSQEAFDQQYVVDEGAGWKYFHVMLNMDDDDLDPHEYRLLGHYRRACGMGGGTCAEPLPETARRTRMGLAKARSTRQRLKDRGYLRLEDVEGGSTIVRLVDRMGDNIRRYAKGARMGTSDQPMAEAPEVPEVTSDTPTDTPIKSERRTPIKNDRAIKSERGGLSKVRGVTQRTPLSKVIGNRNNYIEQQKNPTPQGGVDASDRTPLFDALAVCCWKMPQGFKSKALGKDGGRVGKLQRELLAALEMEEATARERAKLASEIYLSHRRWKVAYPHLAYNRELTVFLSWLYWCRERDPEDDHLFFESNDQAEPAEKLVQVAPGVYQEQ